MAKKKSKKSRLNMRVVILLVLVGLGIVVGVGLSSSRVRNWIWPPDPAAAAERAAGHVKAAEKLIAEAEALEAEGKDAAEKYKAAHEEYDLAAKEFKETFGFSKDHERGAEFTHLWGKMLIEQAKAGGGLGDARRRDLHNEGINCLRNAMQRDPNYTKSQRLICEELWPFAVKQPMRRDDPRLALRRFVKPGDFIDDTRKLLKLDKKDHLTWFRRARVRMLYTDIDGEKANEILSDLQEAIKLKPDEREYWLYKAAFEERIKRISAANKTFESAIDAFKTAHGKLKGQLPAPGQGDKLGLHEKFDELCEEYARVHIAYAMYLRRQNIREEAMQHLDQAVKTAPKSILPLLTKAGFLQRDNRAEEALPVLKRALEIDKTSYLVYRDLAIVYRMLNQPDKALAVLRNGVKTLADQASQSDVTPKEAEEQKFARYQLNYELAGSLVAAVGTDVTKEKREELLKEARACAAIVRELGSKAKGYPESLEGRIAYLSGNIDKARELLEQAAIEFGQRFEPTTLSLLMQLYLRSGEPGKAEKIVDLFLDRTEYRRNVPILLTKAELQMSQNKWTEAERRVRQALDIEPESKPAANMLAVIRLRVGETEIFDADLDMKNPALLRLVLRRVDELLAEAADEQKAKAVALIEDLYKRAPDDTNVILKLLHVYESLNRDKDVEKLLAKVKTDKPELAERIEYAQIFVAEKDPAKRLAMQVERVTKTVKDDFDRAMALADLYRSARQIQLFRKHLEVAAKLKPEDAGVIVRRFELAVSEKKWTEAEAVVAAATKANTDGTGGKLMGARLADVRGKVDIALKMYSDILAAKSNHMRARLARAELYFRQGQLDEAAADFQTIWSSNPGSAIAAVRMMMITQRQGKTAEFDEWLDHADRLAPRDPNVLAQITNRAQREAANPDEIIAKREKQLVQNPNDLNNRLQLGMLYERVKKPSKAEQMYRSVHANAQDRLFGTRILAGFYGRTGRLGEADALIQDLLKTTTKKVEAYVLYGEFLTPYKPDQARQAYGKAILEDSKNPLGHQALAQFLASRGDMRAAIHSMTRCVELRKDAPGLVKTLVSYELRDGRFGDANRRLDALLQENPSDAQALQLKAQLLLQRDGDVAKAEDMLTKAISLNPQDVNSLVVRANLYVQIPDMKKAKADLERASVMAADNVAVALRLAAVHASLREYGQAESRLTSVLARRANMPQAIEQLVGLYSVQKKWTPLEALLAKARAAYPENPRYPILEYQMWTLRKEQTKAIAALTAALKISPDDPIVIRIYFGGLLAAEQYDKVVEAATPKLEEKELFPWLPAMHARALAKTGKVAEAEKLFKALISKVAPDMLAFVAGQMREGLGSDATVANLPKWRGRPKEWQLFGVMGNLYRLDDQHAKAVDAVKKARGLVPDDSPRQRALLSVQLGMAYYRMGKLVEAEKEYKDALKDLPKNKNLLNNLAYLYVEDLKQPQKALKHAEDAYRLDRRNANVVDTYAWVLANLKKYDEAEKLLTDSIAIGNAVPATRQHLGWVYEQQGKLDEALRQYRNGQEMIADKEKNKKIYDQFAEAIKRVQAKKQNS